MKKFIISKKLTDEKLILSYEERSVILDEMGLSFTVDDILESFYQFSKLMEEMDTKKIIVQTRICNGYLPKEFDLYDNYKYTKKFSITLDDIYQFLYKRNILTDPVSIYQFLHQKYPTIELYCNSLGYLIMIIENIINTQKISNVLRKCGFRISQDQGNMIELSTPLKKIIKRYKNNI